MFQWLAPPLSRMEESDLRQIVEAALRIVQRVPMTVDGTEEFMALLRAFGCRIEGRKVHFPPAVIDRVMAEIAAAKKTAQPRPEVLPTEVEWSTSGQAGWTADTRNDELRPCRKADLAAFSRVVEAIPGLGRSHPTYIPQDAPLRTREMHAFATIVLNSSKPYRVSLYSPEALKPYMAILEVVCGDPESARKMAFDLLPAKVWVNTPMMISRECITAAMEFRRLTGRPLAIDCMPVVGAATPVTVAGGMALITAEVIACNAISLAVDRRLCGWTGHPLFFDMKSGVHTQVGPENCVLWAAVAHMAEHLFGERRNATVAFATAACVPGLQSMTEHAFSAAWNFMNGSRSFGGLATLAHADVGSTVQLMMDLEIVGWLRHAAQGFEVDAESLAEETILAVAPKGAYFLDTDHTAAHFREASWFPELMDRRVVSAWKDSPTTMLENARRRALELERSAPNRCPLSDAQKKEVHRIMAATDRELG